MVYNMEWLKKIFPKISYDKKLHFGVSFIIAVIATATGNVMRMNWIQALYAGLCISLASGFGKEYGDKLNPSNTWDWKDVIADTVGALLGAGLVCWI